MIIVNTLNYKLHKNWLPQYSVI